MRIYATLAFVMSVAFGLLPIVIAKTTDQGDELCDLDLLYSPEPVCVLLWGKVLLSFALYFAMAALFFSALWLIWKITVGRNPR